MEVQEERQPFKALPLNRKILERAPSTETYLERKSAPPITSFNFKAFRLNTDKRHDKKTTILEEKLKQEQEEKAKSKFRARPMPTFQAPNSP